MKKRYNVAKSDRGIKMVAIIFIILLDILGELSFELIFAGTRIGKCVNMFRLIAGIFLILLFVGSIVKEAVKKEK